MGRIVQAQRELPLLSQCRLKSSPRMDPGTAGMNALAAVSGWYTYAGRAYSREVGRRISVPCMPVRLLLPAAQLSSGRFTAGPPTACAAPQGRCTADNSLYPTWPGCCPTKRSARAQKRRRLPRRCSCSKWPCRQCPWARTWNTPRLTHAGGSKQPLEDSKNRAFCSRRWNAHNQSLETCSP